MATLTIKVATQGSLYGVNNISRTGHAWISLKDEDNKSYSFGFSLEGVITNDDSNYKEAFKSVGVGYIYSRDINISEYNILNNTCVNFVWNALEYAGLNPKGFKGDNIPINNINNFEILAEALNSNKREE